MFEKIINRGPEEDRRAKHAYSLKVSTGHVIRMPDERLPKKVFYGELQEGNCSHGGKIAAKPLCRISTYQYILWKRLYRIDLSCAVSLTKEKSTSRQGQEKAQSEKKTPTPKTKVGKNQTNNQVLIP